MNRSLDIKKTRFVVPEIYIGEHLIDKIQCDNFQLEVNDTFSTLTFRMLINMRPTLVYGADDLAYFKNHNDDFFELLLKDGGVIKKIVRYFELNGIWRGYQRKICFDFGSNISAVFEINIKNEDKWSMRITKI